MNKNSTFNIQTFGCQMNVHDSEKLAGIMISKGYTQAKEKDSADVIIFNTCAIRDTAEKRVLGQIGLLKKIKQKNPNLITAIGGCMTAQKNIPQLLSKRFPFLDIIFGVENLSNYSEMFDTFLKTGRKQIQTSEIRKTCETENPSRDRMVNAWVNISHGCNNYCTYCIVPYVRGREQSRAISDIVNEVKQLIALGYPQITLLGQNVNSFGNDVDDNSISFPNLLKEIDKIDGKYRIRFMTSHPKDFSQELAETIANSKHICHGIHLPFQSGSNEILKLMNRKYTREHYIQTIEMAKHIIPDAEFTSDCIVGFPGETNEDFENTISLIKQIKFQNIYAFVYSRRKGTVADEMNNQITDDIKKARITKLLEIQNKIMSDTAKQQVGKVYEVLVEGTNAKTGEWMGSTDTGKSVSFESSKDQIGKFVNIKITKAVKSKLFGEIIE